MKATAIIKKKHILIRLSGDLSADSMSILDACMHEASKGRRSTFGTHKAKDNSGDIVGWLRFEGSALPEDYDLTKIEKELEAAGFDLVDCDVVDPTESRPGMLQ